MKTVEIEFKNLLTKVEYEKIFDTLNLETAPTIHNANYYYDDALESLKLANAALRIRHTNTKSEMTLKIKKEKGNIEINIPLEATGYNEKPNVLPILPLPIMDELSSLGVSLKTPLLFQEISTERKEINYKNGLLVVDKTTFANNVVDYELEFEVADFNQGREDFDSILKQFDIPRRASKPKIARAVEYSKK